MLLLLPVTRDDVISWRCFVCSTAEWPASFSVSFSCMFMTNLTSTHNNLPPTQLSKPLFSTKNVVADRLSRRADHNTSEAALLATDARHVQEDHVQEKDHGQEDHVQEDDVQEEDHVQEGHMTQDEAVEWLEEVRLAYRTDRFTAVIADLINAGSTNGAAARP
jgi:hypothetical protein